MTNCATKHWERKALACVLSLLLTVFLVPVVPSSVYAADDAVDTTGNTSDSGSSLQQTSYATDEILVVFNDGVTTEQAESSLLSLDAVDEAAVSDAVEDAKEDAAETGFLAADSDGLFSVMSASDDDMGGALVEVALDEGSSVEEAVAQAQADPAVAYAQPNYYYTLIDDTVATDSGQDTEAEDVTTSVTELWSYTTEAIGTLASSVNDPAVKYLAARSGANAWQLNAVKALSAWDIGRCDNTVTVAVIDTGCNMDHQDLESNILTDYAYDAVNDQALTKDLTGHGSHVAGLVAAVANNNLGTAGVSYNANILPICVFEEVTNSAGTVTGYTAETATVAKAYVYLLKLNLEHPELNIRVANMSLGGYYDSASDDKIFETALDAAQAAGIVTVCSAGNDATSKACYPSDYDQCVSVTALGSDGVTPASYSDYNQSKDIAAPGGGSGAAKSIYSTYYPYANSYTYMSGTSMAAPIVSGALALLWAINPDLTIEQAKAAIYNTAYDISEPTGKEGLYGAGGLDVMAAAESVAQLVVSAPADTVEIGQTLQMNTDDSTGYHYASLTWSVTDDTGSALIDEDGVLTPLKPGSVTVTATWDDDADVTASKEITVTSSDSVYEISTDVYAGSYYLLSYMGTVPQGTVPMWGETSFMKVISGTSTYWQLLVTQEQAENVTGTDMWLDKAEAVTVTRNGEVSGNTSVNIIDAQVAYDLGRNGYKDFTILSMGQWLAADYNNNGYVDALDAFAIQVLIHS